MEQLPLPGLTSPEKIINVASVKHRSPFRYPGGKTWLVPRVRQWLNSLPSNQRKTFVEPFAGGAIVGLTVAFEQLTEHVILVELDEQVGAVWETIINQNQGAWLAVQIERFELTPSNVENLLGRDNLPTNERALQVIVKNRVNRGGILAPGAGRLKLGENGRGLASRWYPQTLAQRIRDIAAIRNRLTFVQGDGLQVIADHLAERDAAFFIDPPYTVAGKKPGNRLYTHADIDHEELFRLAQSLAGDFLMTYDNVPAVIGLARQHQFATHAIPMKNTHHAKQTELLIGRNLTWV